MTTQSTIHSADDVVTFLTRQHEQIKTLFDRVLNTSADARADSFTELRRLLAVHETAEEQIVHPRARTELSNGEEVVLARLTEEHEAKEALAELEKLDPNTAEFETQFRQLRTAVLSHAESEEREEFTQLAAALDENQLEKMRKAVEVAERMAPTRPHPGVESATANTLAGPFAMMLDRARDAMTGKS